MPTCFCEADLAEQQEEAEAINRAAVQVDLTAAVCAPTFRFCRGWMSSDIIYFIFLATLR